MSRTDKDVPYRIAVERYGTEAHDHRFGECDFSPTRRGAENFGSYRYRRTCGLEIEGRYSYTLTFFPRSPAVRAYRAKDLGFERGHLRAWARDAEKLYRGEGLDSMNDLDTPPVTGRHNALWEAW